MPAIINFKICDNSSECSGIPVCPTKAITYNEDKKTLEIDESKCISCGKCVRECPVGAIKAAVGENFEKIKAEYEKDSRKTSDLFVERYGAEPIDPTASASKEYLQQQIDKGLDLVVELYVEEELMCLVKSIPIKELFPKILYYKVDNESVPNLVKNYKIKEFPSLLFFKNGKFIGKIEGYYEYSQKDELITQIKKIIK